MWYTKLMKAVFFEQPGGLEVLQYGDFPDPKPQAGEALVRVKACGLNHLDLWLREDKDNARNIPLPHIPGSDAAGVIEEMIKPRCCKELTATSIEMASTEPFKF